MNFQKEAMRDCNFYISDKKDSSGMAFCMAYKAARESKNNKELCASVGSMICAVAGGVRLPVDLRIPVDLALNGIGVTPREVMLPSEAKNYDINVSDVPKMDWASILVNFCCCILVLLKNNYENEESYKAFMSICIRKMQERVGYNPAMVDLDIPFDFERAEAIRSMLGGVSSALRGTLVKHMIVHMTSEDDKFLEIIGLYDFLFNNLYRFGRDEFNVMNEMLVKPQSLVLNDPRVFEEVNNLNKAWEDAVKSSHRDLDPQSCIRSRIPVQMASKAELLSAVDCLRFPTLFAVARELEKGGDGSSVAESTVISMAGVKLTTVKALVELHRDNQQLIQSFAQL